MITSSSSHEHNHLNTQCEYCHHHTTGIVSNESNSSTSSSSVVTWSSVTSSTFEPITSTSHRKPFPKVKVAPMSSFSSSGDYYPNNDNDTCKSNQSQPIPSATTKTIDDFFRNNNVNPHENAQTKCICSCNQSDHQSTSHQTSSNVTINQSAAMAAAAAAMTTGKPATATTSPDYWYWRWLMESNCTGFPGVRHRMATDSSNQIQNVDNYKRWSSALS
ncbi:hypothetical protein BLA29_009312, partial [Euroglyphus maynei]